MRRALALLVLLALAVGAAGCGSSTSPQDVAKSNGKKVGAAVKELTSARSVSDVQSAVADLRSAYKDVAKNVKDKSGQITSQINAQKATLTSAFNAVKKAASSGDIGQIASAIGVMRTALTSFGDDAKSAASTTDAVAKAFWEGVQDGYKG